MTYETAAAALDAARHGGKLEEIRRIVEAFERQAADVDHWAWSRLLRHACDVIHSHDFGDPQGQAELVRTYARRALQRSHYASMEQELRLLAHLQHDYEDGNQPWPAKRLARSRRWLRLLQLLAEAVEDGDGDSLPRLKPLPPAHGLPSGVAAEHVPEEAVRDAYRSAQDLIRERAEAFAFRWKLKQLRRIYEPLGTRYITTAYAREPYDLRELKQLLDEYLIERVEAHKPIAPRVDRELAIDKVSSVKTTRKQSARSNPPARGKKRTSPR